MKGLDDSSFEGIYRTYWQRLYDYARAKVHDPDIAEEIIQDLFVNLWEQREKLQIRNIENYLFKCVKNHVVDHYKQKLFSDINLIDQQISPDYPSFLDELEGLILQAADKLPIKTREIFMKNRLEGKSPTEVSNELKLPKRTVEYHITLALRQLKLELKDFTNIIWFGILYDLSNKF